MGITAMRVVLYTSEVKSKFKKIKSKIPMNGEQVWNDTPFNTTAGKLLNDRQDAVTQRNLTHADEGNGLLISLSERNYDPQYRNSRSKDNLIAKQCQIKATSREPAIREKNSKKTNSSKGLYELYMWDSLTRVLVIKG